MADRLSTYSEMPLFTPTNKSTKSRRCIPRGSEADILWGKGRLLDHNQLHEMQVVYDIVFHNMNALTQLLGISKRSGKPQ